MMTGFKGKEKTGRDDRIRTCDPHTPSVMRYQAALRPDRVGALTRVFRQGQDGLVFEANLVCSVIRWP